MVAHLVSASSDLALVMDSDGVIRDLSYEDTEYADYGCHEWAGRSWIDTVTDESRVKVQEMLEAALSQGASRWRQINHSSRSMADLPISYSAIRFGSTDRILAIGRDLRPMSALQQRLVSAQVQMEKEYSRLRMAETRYQALFQLSSEAVIVADATTLKIMEANPTASRLLKHDAGQLVGRALKEILDPAGFETVQKLFAKLRIAPRAEDVLVRTAGSGASFRLSASIFKHHGASHFLLRLSSLHDEQAYAMGHGLNGALTDVISRMPDGFVVIGEDRRILTANAAFLDLAQLAEEEQVRGEKVERWLGRTEVDVDILVENLREYGYLRHFPMVVRGEYGSRDEVELTGVAVLGGDHPCYGVAMRKLQPKLLDAPMTQSAGFRSIEQLKQLVGQVPLRDLVRETTDIIEQMCIEAALELTGDNRASAAEMLGLSRQSFYVKLRRHGLGELDGPEDS